MRSSDCGDISKIQMMRFADGVNVRYEKKCRVMDNSKIWKNMLLDGD